MVIGGWAQVYKDKYDFALNQAAWTVFQRCPEKEILKTAIGWSDLSISIASQRQDTGQLVQYYDTKANLLYKFGKARKAIGYERKALAFDAKNKEYINVIDKMQKGQPTW